MKLDTAVDGSRGWMRNLVIGDRRRASAGASDGIVAWLRGQDLNLRSTDYEVGAPDTIRTCGLHLRRVALYPAELRAHLSLLSPTDLQRSMDSDIPTKPLVPNEHLGVLVSPKLLPCSLPFSKNLLTRNVFKIGKSPRGSQLIETLYLLPSLPNAYTLDLCLRRAALYPAELRAQCLCS
jgi:hypothetical protein